MNTNTSTWSDVRAKAAVPGSAILTRWRAEREANRQGIAIANDVTDSAVIRSGDTDAMLKLFNLVRSPSGVHVTPESAMRISSVFACVQRIAGGIATLPLRVYERTADGRKPVDSPLWYLLNEQPTARYTAASHWEHVSSHQLLRGDGFTFIGRTRSGSIKELVPLPWSAVTRERYTVDGQDRLKYYVNDVRTYGVEQDDMLHFPGFGFDGKSGMSVISWAGRHSVGNAIAMEEYSGRFFSGGAHPSIVLTTDSTMKKEQIENLQAAFAAKYSGIDNAHRLPLVLTEGLKAAPLSLSAEDAQLLDARKFQVVDIARAFGVPPHLIGETSASTSWGAGIEAMSRAFITFTLQPHLVRIEQEINRKFFLGPKFFVEFDRDALMQGDSKSQSEFFRGAIGGPGTGPGWMTVNEVRRSKNLPPVPGEADQLFNPNAATSGKQGTP